MKQRRRRLPPPLRTCLETHDPWLLQAGVDPVVLQRRAQVMREGQHTVVNHVRAALNVIGDRIRVDETGISTVGERLHKEHTSVIDTGGGPPLRLVPHQTPQGEGDLTAHRPHNVGDAFFLRQPRQSHLGRPNRPDGHYILAAIVGEVGKLCRLTNVLHNGELHR
ncbi:hypothetical protein AGDE_15012 [Angomonas deanei]|nr:hypothetical protein AGDE_15012 [Angomonas deanei]|eukprot:EPY19836.1 hypothetical protein AGDE_15012 [Angomonas deanei]